MEALDRVGSNSDCQIICSECNAVHEQEDIRGSAQDLLVCIYDPTSRASERKLIDWLC